MTAQEIFDKIVVHLRQQKIRSLDPKTGSCKYRANSQADCPIKCAVGAIIEDHEYSPKMEGANVIDLITSKSPSDLPASIYHRIRDNSLLLYKLQAVHDGLDNDWETKFLEIAYQYNLQYNPPTSIDQ